MPYLPGLRSARERRLMTMEALHQATGVAVSTIVHLEAGRQEARMSTARKLAEALKVEPEELLRAPEEGLGAAA